MPPAAKFKSIDDYRASLTPAQLAVVDALRKLASSAAPGVTEHLKWNAPSFVHEGEDRITLGLDKSGHVRVILHRGVKAKDTAGFSFEAPGDLVQWAAVDRGVMTFASAEEVEARRDEIADVFRRWLAVA